MPEIRVFRRHLDELHGGVIVILQAFERLRRNNGGARGEQRHLASRQIRCDSLLHVTSLQREG